ncbi:MAG: LysR substrate-binding domain-containing protein, partial [Schleiferiaceae bacterium]|nr:LysR substrate-binding domain-containing protein [Schleiferiaceae bacterium]
RNSAIRVEVGQLETLIRMADAGLGMTLLPELAVMELPRDKQSNAIPLSKPRPVRRIAMVQLPGQRKQGIAAALATVIQAQVPAKFLKQVDQDLVMSAS